jgi:hypothetical protein
MSGSAYSSRVAIFPSRPSRCAPASESLSRACSMFSALKIGRINAASRPCWSLRVPEAVPEEVDRAALPAAAEDLRDRRLQPGVRVADGELHSGPAALDETSEKLGPERLGLGLADIDRQDLPSTDAPTSYFCSAAGSGSSG